MFATMLSAMFALLFTLPLASAWQQHRVTVGPNAQLIYDPPFISADIGDKVIFSFRQKNHTVTQSSFQSPCTPLLGPDGVTVIAFNSGFNPVGADVVDNFPEVSLTVLTTDPLWFHCEQTGHCAQGMVFAINPPADGNTFDKFKAAALATAAPPTGGSHARAENNRATRYATARAAFAAKD
ncbi:hypothetical protein BOTBODRAFT_178339 [Botryobasidium botryosum FD-172 SS1]|uniref:Phytocyanin domain-containing protein n=1 Tax=Botryobasidium botryosum (strain FD-172 SS1) TaxID=930990 RepID=A0A067MES1_BOTB1|nr:hypothetical protein BOTBODRAFT_178339 [Botryobasidium botryosum FD-172 SS1]